MLPPQWNLLRPPKIESELLQPFLGYRSWSLNSRLLVRKLCVIAGHTVDSPSSCCNDFVAVLVVQLDEPTENPGTTIGK